ncbi:MAG TPA: peptidoglycan-binding protein [Terriglobia bacterium]|nr:peptidoglycan-binding protein [Terriglobia bacterium]
MALLKVGDSGEAVAALQQRLRKLGFDPGAAHGEFTAATEAAVRAFQSSVGLAPDGVAGPNTIAALQRPNVSSNVKLEMVAQMFPNTPPVNIQFHLPFVLKALFDADLADKNMVLMALATIRAETEPFQPMDEQVSAHNTSPEGPPFDKYDNRAELGNLGPPDGALFKGRGFVQLTGRGNYEQFGHAIFLGDRLVHNPELANDPDVAARILAAYLGNREARIRSALAFANLDQARQLVNGGTHGLEGFRDAFQRGEVLLPDSVKIETEPKASAS